MIDIGLIYIKDVVKTDGSLKTTIYTDLRNKNTFFKDFSLISKIIQEFKTLINAGNDEITETNPGIIEYKSIYARSKPFYNEMKRLKELTPKSHSFWIRLFPSFTFKAFYSNKIEPIKVAKIKEFLFKVQHNICACGDNLFKWKINTVRRCIYCNVEIQTIKHLLWDAIILMFSGRN